MGKTHYETLEVMETASSEAIKGAYKHLAQRWHPDRNSADVPESEIKTSALNEAYRVLSNPESRRKYDDILRAQRLRETEQARRRESHHREEVKPDRHANNEPRTAKTSYNGTNGPSEKSPASGPFLLKALGVAAVICAVAVRVFPLHLPIDPSSNSVVASAPITQNDVAETSHTALQAPATDDRQLWIDYLSDAVMSNVGPTTQQPYVYFLPGIRTADFSDQFDKLSRKAAADVGRGILPGNFIAYGSPASSQMADLIVNSYENVPPGSMRGVRVLFIGAREDEPRVAAVVIPTGADYVFTDTGR